MRLTYMRRVLKFAKTAGSFNETALATQQKHYSQEERKEREKKRLLERLGTLNLAEHR